MEKIVVKRNYLLLTLVSLHIIVFFLAKNHYIQKHELTKNEIYSETILQENNLARNLTYTEFNNLLEPLHRLELSYAETLIYSNLLALIIFLLVLIVKGYHWSFFVLYFIWLFWVASIYLIPGSLHPVYHTDVESKQLERGDSYFSTYVHFLCNLY